MNSIFVARGTADAVPIWFVTAATYADVRTTARRRGPRLRRRGGLRAQGRAPSAAAGTESGLGGVLFGIEGERRGEGSVPARPPAAAAAGRRLPLRQRAARCAARRARLRARLLPLHALPQDGGARRSSSTCRKASIATSLQHIVEAVTLARDLINTPANDMGPAELEAGRAQACGASQRRRSARSSATICWRRIFR